MTKDDGKESPENGASQGNGDGSKRKKRKRYRTPKYDANVKTRAMIEYVIGRDKSHREIAQIVGVKRPATIQEWIEEGNWKEYRERLEKHDVERASRVFEATVAVMNEREIELGTILQNYGKESLDRLIAAGVYSEDAGEITQLIKCGSDMRRRGNGISKEINPSKLEDWQMVALFTSITNKIATIVPDPDVLGKIGEVFRTEASLLLIGQPLSTGQGTAGEGTGGASVV